MLTDSDTQGHKKPVVTSSKAVGPTLIPWQHLATDAIMGLNSDPIHTERLLQVSYLCEDVGKSNRVIYFGITIKFKTDALALAGVVQWIDCQSVNPRVTHSIPSQHTCLGCGPGPQQGAHERQPHIVSLPFSLPYPLKIK